MKRGSKTTFESSSMLPRIACIILICQLICCGFCNGQKTTVINHFKGDTTGRGTAGFSPSGTAEHRIIINYYEPADQQQLDNFQELVSSYLNLYIDRCAEIVDNDVKLKKSKKETLRELNDIVKGVLEFYEYEKLKDFKGFSKMVENKLADIDKLDFRKSDFAAGAADEESKQRMQRFYMQKEISDLKLLANMEVGIFSDGNLMVISAVDETLIDDGAKQKLIENYTAFDPNLPLKPIKVQLSEASLALINFKDTTTLNGSGSAQSLSYSNTDNEFSAQILALLESNNAKLDGMQKQIDDLRTEQLKLWQQQQDEKSFAMQKQIDDLREMVFALVQMNTGDAIADGGKATVKPEKFNGATVSNVPGSMNVYFAKSMTVLDAGSKLALNEIVDILARDPSLNLIITGFADKTGDAAKNLLLSQQRANAVKKFLTGSGLPSERFITKYFGDRDSKQENTNDRKVVIEFVR